MIPLKVWPSTAQGCNHQWSIRPQLHLSGSAAVGGGVAGLSEPCAAARMEPNPIKLAPTRDLNPCGRDSTARVHSQEYCPYIVHYHCTKCWQAGCYTVVLIFCLILWSVTMVAVYGRVICAIAHRTYTPDNCWRVNSESWSTKYPNITCQYVPCRPIDRTEGASPNPPLPEPCTNSVA